MVGTRIGLIACALTMGLAGPIPESRAAAHGPDQDSPWSQCRQQKSWLTCIGLLISGRLGPAAAHLPPPAPPPPPPPPPAAVFCSSPVITFFDWNVSDIAPEGASVLDRVIGDYLRCRPDAIRIDGHTDRSEAGSDHGRALAQRRAEAAKAYLVARGVPEGVISLEAHGASRPMVETAEAVREPLNRRVELQY